MLNQEERQAILEAPDLMINYYLDVNDETDVTYKNDNKR